jgi:hypothetical protein
MSEDLSREEVHRAVDRAVEELLEAAGVTGPPVDALALARHHLGLLPVPGARRPEGGPPAKPAPQLRSELRSRAGGRKQVSPGTESTAEQHQWAAAQAIGAHLKPDLLRRLGISPEEGRALRGESLANLLAGRLLLPASWFGDDARGCGYDLPELKRRYATASHELIAWRLLDLSAPCIITVVDNGHVHRRRSNAWRIGRDLEGPERECQRYVHHYSRPRVVCEGGWTVQGWPIHKPDWKREILRSVVDREDWGE